MNPISGLPEHEDYHVAFFTNTYLPFVGGVSLSVDLYHRYLSQLGDRVRIYTPEYEGATEDHEDVRRLTALKQFNNTDFSLPLPISLKPVFDNQSEHFDVVHVHHPFLLGEMGHRMARQQRLPLVFTYHTQYERYTHYVPFDQEVASRTIIRHAADFCDVCDLVIAPTHDIERTLRDRGVQTAIEVLPTGIDLSAYESADGRRQRRELGIEEDASLLVYVGRLAFEKNLDFLIRSCLQVLRSNTRAHLAIVGEGKNRDSLEELAKEDATLASRVHFAGKLTGQALRDLYHAATLFVFASKTETQGMVVAEAMGAGTPVVALDADGVRDVVRDGENGRLLDADSPEEAFAQAVCEALDDEGSRLRWREGAAETARQFDMPRLAKRLHGFYRTLKLLPNYRLKDETLSFGLIRSYFETVWEDISKRFDKI